jgi:Ankyrin repeats (3 copies)
MSPQAYLDVLIHSRGYSTRRYRTLQTGYHSKPTAFQKASYHVYLVKLVRSNDTEALRSVMQSGISPNPCNAFGESLVHMVCRRGDYNLLRVLLDSGTSIQVSDDYGRTPLHDACWAAEPSFETVELIVDKDIALFHMTDSRGAVPLSYVRPEHWPLWIAFLDSKKDKWWPVKTEEDQPAPLIDVAPNERPVPEPENALSIELAGMVASGVMSPAEAALLMEEDDDDEEEDEDEDDDTEDEDGSDDDSEEGSDDIDDDDDDDEDDNETGADHDLNGFSADDMANIMSLVHQSKRNKQ